MDELFEAIRDVLVEEMGEDLGYSMSLQADRLCAVVRDVKPNSAPASAVFKPGERLVMLGLVRKEIRKIAKDIERAERRTGQAIHDAGEYGRYMISRKDMLQSVYHRLGGNPRKMNETLRRLRD